MLRKLLSLGTLVAAAVGLLSTAAAHAYSNNHDYYARSRPSWSKNVYVNQQAFYASGADSTTLQDGTEAKHQFSGYSLQTSVGAEFMRFLQFGLYYSNLQLSDVKSSQNESRGHEGGGEARIVLSTPVMNVVVGGGLFLAKNEFISGLERQTRTGHGFVYTGELNYHVSSSVHLVLAARQTQADMKDPSGSDPSRTLRTTRIGGGVNIWL